jgi:thiaminase
LAISTPAEPEAQQVQARVRAQPTEALQRVAAHRIDVATTEEVAETLAAEVPVAMQYNARTR